MHRQARETEILRALGAAGAVRVADLVDRLGVSDETVRRDLKRMSAEGLVRRMHGGVMLPDPDGEPAFRSRMRQNSAAKQAIGRAAAALVRDGDSLMLDTGTTTAYLAQALRGHRDLLAVTNSVDIARVLATRNGNRVYMAGGELRADDGAALGPSAIRFIEQFRVRWAFLSVGAIDIADGFMDYDLEEAEFSRVVMQRAERTVFVADDSKFGRRGLVTVCPLAKVETLVTNAAPPAAFADAFSEALTNVLIAGQVGEDRNPEHGLRALPES